MKRKADASSATTKPTKLQIAARDWSCALCQVSATSEAGLNQHLEGKKHKAKQESLWYPSDELKRLWGPLLMSWRRSASRSEKQPRILQLYHYTECNASSQQPWGQPLEPVSEKSSGPSSLLHPGLMVDTSAFMPLVVPNNSNLSPMFSTISLLLMPKNKMEVFQKLPQDPHFRKAWNCPPELRGGRAIGLMVSFADMAESIKNMRI